jgi:hypothetical protein
MIRRIRDLLYGQGFTISGARNRLQDDDTPSTDTATRVAVEDTSTAFADAKRQNMSIVAQKAMALNSTPLAMRGASDIQGLRSELLRIREILSLD